MIYLRYESCIGGLLAALDLDNGQIMLEFALDLRTWVTKRYIW